METSNSKFEVKVRPKVCLSPDVTLILFQERAILTRSCSPGAGAYAIAILFPSAYPRYEFWFQAVTKRMPRDESSFISGSIYSPSAKERALQGIVHVTIFSYT